MDRTEIRGRVNAEYQTKFAVLEHALAHLHTKFNDVQAFTKCARQIGEVNGVIDTALALGVDVGRVRISHPNTLGAIRARVLREKSQKRAAQAVGMRPDVAEVLQASMRANVGSAIAHRR